MGVLDSYVTIGKEAVAYGTAAAALTRGIESRSDPVKIARDYLVSNGMRPGFDATRSTRRRAVAMGGTGDIEVDLLNKSHGLLLEAMIGVPTVTAGTPTEMEFAASAAGPTTSLSVQVARGRHTGGLLPETALGGMCTSWEVTQKVGGEDALARLKMTLDYQRAVTNIAAATATYPTGEWMYAWPDCTITVGGSGCVLDLTLTGDNALKTDRRCLKGTTDKEQPYRTGVPSSGGTLSTDYDGDTLYDLFRLGDTTSVVVTWAGPAGSLLRFTYPAAQFVGESPVVAPGSSTQSAPFVALSNGTDPAVTVDYFTADLAP